MTRSTLVMVIPLPHHMTDRRNEYLNSNSSELGYTLASRVRWWSLVFAAVSAAMWLAVSSGAIAAEGGGAEPIVETSDATIEARDGRKMEVVFAAANQATLVFRPARSVWDWSATSKLFIPVENPGDVPIALQLDIEDARGESLSGNISMAPHSGGDVAIWIEARLPRSKGMIAGPSLRAAGLEPNILPVTATKGSIDASHVVAVRLGALPALVPQHLTIGRVRVEPLSEADRTAYNGIVDGFGQFRPGAWPEKVSSVEQLRASGIEETRELAQWRTQSPRQDRFGGLKGSARFQATGFFRTERRDGRWWLITPEGNPFFSIGVDVVATPGPTYVQGREFMFRDLPARDGELAAHWSESDSRRGLGVQQGRLFDHGRAFDFYTANLQRKFGADWRAYWRDETLMRFKAWGFNTIGDWSNSDLWAMHRLPYTVPLSLEGEYAKLSSVDNWWGLMADPFSTQFAAAADKMAREAAARFHGDPYLIGYFVDNELAWGKGSPSKPKDYYALAINALGGGPESSAKSALVADLVGAYREPERLGQAWGISLTSWDQLRGRGFRLAPSTLNNPAVRRDLAAFTRRFAETYFRTIAEALHRYDPDHLYLGSRFAWQTAEAVEACAHWCDIVTFNRYRRSIADDPSEWAWFHQLGKPALIGEFQFGSIDRGLFWEGLMGVGTESQRGPAYSRYLHSVADNPDFVGAHWFQYVDEPLTGRILDGENAHIGFVTVADLPYKNLVAAARSANTSVLRELQRAASKSP